MNRRNRLRVASFLYEVAVVQESLDQLKLSLKIYEPGTVTKLFKRIAKHNERIGMKELEECLAGPRGYSREELSRLMSRLTNDSQHCCNCDQLRKALTPLKYTNKPTSLPQNQDFRSDLGVLQRFHMLVHECIKAESQLDYQRVQLRDLNVWEVFDDIVPEMIGYITLHSLRAFMGQCEIACSHQRLGYMIAGLRKERRFCTIEVFLMTFRTNKRLSLPFSRSARASPEKAGNRFVDDQSTTFSQPPQLLTLKRFAESNLQRIRSYRQMTPNNTGPIEMPYIQTEAVQAKNLEAFKDSSNLPIPTSQRSTATKAKPENNITFGAEGPRYPPIPITIELSLVDHPSLSSNTQKPSSFHLRDDS